MKGSDVSVVVCTKNNVQRIRQVLKRIIDECPLEIIVVDGNSTDGTKRVLESMPVRVITDPGIGLAYARKLALEEVKGKYVCFIGDDNIIGRGSLGKLKDYIIEHDWCGGGYQTRVRSARKNYWGFCGNIRWKVRFTEGERRVVGTPYLFETEVLRAAAYDSECSFSDDCDIDERIPKVTTKKMGYTNVICYEIGKANFEETRRRFLMYGRSDAEYWKKYSPQWGIKRKIRSMLHPLRDEFWLVAKSIHKTKLRIYVIPYLLMITVIRYWGWIRYSLLKNR